MSGRVLIFANPIAGRGRGRPTAERLSTALTTGGYRVDVILDRPADVPGDRLAGATAAIAIGGDGTLRGVVDRLISAGGELPPVLPVPMGTANLMGRHLGVRWRPATLGAAVLATLARREVRRLDAGRANGRPFLLMAGVGLDAQVVHLLDKTRRGPIGYASYVVPTAVTLAGYSFPSVAVEVDGRTVLADGPALVFVGNVREYGTGLPILTRAVPDDGLLDVCAMPCRDHLALVELAIAMVTGDHVRRPGVVYARGRTARVSGADVPVQVDGDPAGFTPLDLDVLPGRVPFLVPA